MLAGIEVSVSGVWIASMGFKTVTELIEVRKSLIEAGFEVKLVNAETKAAKAA